MRNHVRAGVGAVVVLVQICSPCLELVCAGVGGVGAYGQVCQIVGAAECGGKPWKS